MSVRDTRQPLVTAPNAPKLRQRRPVFTFLVAAAALGLAGYVWKTSTDQADRAQADNRQLTALATQVAGLSRELRTTQDQAAGRARTLAEVQAKLDSLNASLSADQRKQWQLGEVDYYVRLAEQHLLLTRDVQGSRALLDVADRILADTNDNALLKLRQAIAQDRLALAAAARVDVAGLYLRLGALDERLAALVLPAEAGGGHRAAGEVQKPAAIKASAEGAGLSERGSNLMEQGWAKFRGLITVRRYDEPIRPLLTDAERGLIREKLRLQLGQAQLALLRGESTVYQSSLKQAGEGFSRYFQLLPAAEYAAVQQELEALGKTDIRPAVPALKASVSALEAVKPRQPVPVAPAAGKAA